MDERLGRQLGLTGKYLAECFEHRLAAYDSTLATWVVLHCLAEGDRISQRELAARMHIEAPTLVRHLDRLGDEGLLVRRRSQQDRRSVKVELTEVGRRRHQQLMLAADQFEDDLCALMSAQERATLSRLLDRIFTFLVSDSHRVSHGAALEDSHARPPHPRRAGSRPVPSGGDR